MLALHDLARRAAVVVELLDGDVIFMRGNLENAVRRRVDDQTARFLLLTAIVVDDLRAGIRFVAKDFLAERLFEFRDDLRREAVRIRRHRTLGDDARDFPMARRRVLAARELAQAGKAAERMLYRLAAADAIDVEHAELREIRRVIFLCARDGTQRVAIAVAEISRIGLRTNAEAVEHDDECALDACFLHLISPPRRIHL